MDPQFKELAEHLERKLAEQFVAMESRLVGQYKTHAEEMKAELKLAAEGHARTLASIHHTLDHLKKIVD